MSPPGPAAAPPPAPPAPRRDDEHFRNKAKHISYYAVIKSFNHTTDTRLGGRGIRPGGRRAPQTRHALLAQSLSSSISRNPSRSRTASQRSWTPFPPLFKQLRETSSRREALTDRRRSASTIASGTPKPLSKRSSVVRLSARSSLSRMPLKTSRVWASTAPQPPAAAPHCR